MHDFLTKIIENKKLEVAALKKAITNDEHHPIKAVLNGGKKPKKSLL